MKTVHVDTGKPYDVQIGREILYRCGGVAAALPGKRYRKVAVITDSNVDPLYAQAVINSFQAEGFETGKYVFTAGESSKNITIAMDIVAFLANRQFTRSDLLVALGGGVVGDITGFVASVYLRGVDYMQIPTTLLAAVDSSVGGKTAVNIPQGKNLVGAFWQPAVVLCDVDTLSTLTSEVFADGMAEVIKYGCIWDRALFDDLAKRGVHGNLDGVIARCVEIKAEVVRQDERDNGLRQILNFGHTLGHGVEKKSLFAVPHGRAVAIGMYRMALAGEAAGITRAGSARRLRDILDSYRLPHSCDYPLPALCKECLGDKKRSGDAIGLVVLEEIGKCRIHPVNVDTFEAFMSGGTDDCL